MTELEAFEAMYGKSYLRTKKPREYAIVWEAWQAATLAEREACAKECETGDVHEAQIPGEWLNNCDLEDDEVMTRLYCAAAIRMRSNVRIQRTAKSAAF